jgi:hypothetical protein
VARASGGNAGLGPKISFADCTPPVTRIGASGGVSFGLMVDASVGGLIPVPTSVPASDSSSELPVEALTAASEIPGASGVMSMRFGMVIVGRKNAACN